MAKQKYKLTKEQQKELQQAFIQSKKGTERIRYQAVRLYAAGYPVAEILEITGSNRTSLMEWCCKYREQGMKG